MLKTRIITALVLLALVVPSLFFLPQAYWALLVALFIGVAAWEWGGLLGYAQSGRLLLGAAMAALCSAVSLLAPAAIGVGAGDEMAAGWVVAAYGIAAVFWCLVIPLWLRQKWRLTHGLTGTCCRAGGPLSDLAGACAVAACRPGCLAGDSGDCLDG